MALRTFLAFFLSVLTASITLPASAAESQKAPLLYSHYEFAHLSVEQRMAYIKMLRGVMVEIEALQDGKKSAQFEPLLQNLLFATANAATVFKAGEACVYAGFISTYNMNKNPHTCNNPQPCEGDRSRVTCNPMLVSGNLCTEAKDGATARCMKMIANESADELKAFAKSLANADKRAAWTKFTEQFHAFCDDVLVQRVDYNKRSCQLIKDRVAKLETEVKAVPPAAPMPPPTAAAAPPAPAPKPEPIKSLGSAPVCKGDSKSGNCETCPVNEPDIVKVPTTSRDLDSNSKYTQLLKVMANACSVKNESDKVQTRSVDQLIQLVGVCRSEDYAGKYLDKDQEGTIKELVAGNSKAMQDLAGGRWLNDKSVSMQDYFGINIRDARQAFCTDNLEQSIRVLNQLPEADFATADLARTQSKELDRLMQTANQEERTAPGWASSSIGGDRPVSTRQFNDFKRAYVQRRRLAECISKNKGNEVARTHSVPRPSLPPDCKLDSWEIADFNSFYDHGIKLAAAPECRQLCVKVKGSSEKEIKCWPQGTGLGCDNKGDFPKAGPYVVSSLKCEEKKRASAPPSGTGTH